MMTEQILTVADLFKICNMPVQPWIEHSGYRFYSLYSGHEYGFPIWPIEEYIVRTNHSAQTDARIFKANPYGKEEAVQPLAAPRVSRKPQHRKKLKRKYLRNSLVEKVVT